MLNHRIDNDGFFIEDTFEAASETVISAPVPQGFYLPRWSGSAWIEGFTAEQVKAAELAKIEYSITPSITVASLGDSITIGVTGKPNETVTLDVGSETVDILIDENGNGSDTFTPQSAGNYYIGFSDKTLSNQIVKIEAVP